MCLCSVYVCKYAVPALRPIYVYTEPGTYDIFVAHRIVAIPTREKTDGRRGQQQRPARRGGHQDVVPRSRYRSNGSDAIRTMVTKRCRYS